jgi:hypothetical protein
VIDRSATSTRCPHGIDDPSTEPMFDVGDMCGHRREEVGYMAKKEDKKNKKDKKDTRDR